MQTQDTPQKTNRLAEETSPYLLQHAHNPIDWYPWCDEALQRARDENKPIFLSIGYSACHWCHVMAHESFEDPAIAEFMNAHFVPIKVDREERPDLDDIYMAATVAQNGGGGWPMSVFLTPQLEPFYSGTYFPPTDRYGKPGFMRLLRALADAWQNSEDNLRNTAKAMREYLVESSQNAPGVGAQITGDLLTGACIQLTQRFDETYGGWGAAPKFPGSASVLLLLREHFRTGNAPLKQMALHTLDCMADGGIYDHIGGGFHRYSVDAQWLVPHFEKMLYDNAQLAVAYTEAYQATGNTRYREIAEATLDYLLRDMRHPDGAFYSAEDADSEGEEGKFYIWDKSEIDEILGADADLFCSYYNIKPGGNFPSPEHYHAGLNIPHTSSAALWKDLHTDRGNTTPPQLDGMRQKLLNHRAKRVRPGLDDKILTSWNALAISAFAIAGRVFDKSAYREAAQCAALFIKGSLYLNGALYRAHRNGKTHLPAYLDDYAFLVNALLDLYECGFDVKNLQWADELCEKMLGLFWEESEGCFYFSGAEHKDLIIRPRPSQDGAEPAGSSVAALALLRLARHLGKPEYRDMAERAICANQLLAKQYPQAAMNLLLAVSEFLHPGPEIAFFAPNSIEQLEALLRVTREKYAPNAAFAAHAGNGDVPSLCALLSGRRAIDGKATAYVCREQTCSSPITDAATLTKELA